jgi:hypothetical protein
MDSIIHHQQALQREHHPSISPPDFPLPVIVSLSFSTLPLFERPPPDMYSTPPTFACINPPLPSPPPSSLTCAIVFALVTSSLSLGPPHTSLRIAYTRHGSFASGPSLRIFPLRRMYMSRSFGWSTVGYYWIIAYYFIQSSSVES